ncbi:peptidylprolyl isomerase, partial [Acinetobacter baumannii]|nr:peptidylprolyl isomerase [Acinetobacter baumannii]
EAEKPRLIAEVEKNKVASVYSDTVNSLNETIVGNDSLDAVVQQVKGTKIESLNGVTLATQNPYLSDPNVK